MLRPVTGATALRKGRVYRCKEPAALVRVVGQAPLETTVFEMERLRCNASGQVFTADAPESVGKDKYDATVVSMIAVLKYSSGVRFKRRSAWRRKREPGDERIGIFTSGIASMVGTWRIALFFTMPKHAGENIAAVLKRRAGDSQCRFKCAMTYRATQPRVWKP